MQIIRLRWRLFSSATLFILILAIVKAFAQPKIYQATLTLLLEPDFIALPTADLPIGGDRQRPYVPPEFRDYQTILEIIRSREVLAPALTKIIASYPNEDYRSLSNKITARHIAGSELVEINFRDADPKKVEFVLEQLSDAYFIYIQKASLKGLSQAFKLVEEQLPIAENKVDKLQQELEEFRQDSGFYNPEQQSENLYGQLDSLVSQSREVDASFNATMALFQDLKNRVQINAEAEGANSTALSLFVLKNLESDIDTTSSLASQAVAEIETTNDLNSSKIARLDNALELLEARNNIVAISEQKSTLEQEIQRLREEVKAFVSLDTIYANIQRELDVSVTSLNQLLTAEEELRLEASRQIPPWEIVTGTESMVTPLTSIPKTLFMGLVAALFTGIGAILVINQIDDKYTSDEDIQNSLAYPILGVIPFKPASKRTKHYGIEPKTSTLGNDFGFYEAFELLNVNLQLLNPDRNISSVVISSAVPGEGKSTTAQGLARSIHQSGKRTLLIDADFRRPSLSLDISQDSQADGLSEMIISEKEDILSFVNHVPDGSDIVLAGKVPPDTIRLFSSKRFDSVFEELQRHYDVIIFDAPPTLGLADARLLSHKTDGLLLTINTNTRKQTIARLIQELTQSKTSVLGVVINNSLNKANFHDHTRAVYEYYNDP